MALEAEPGERNKMTLEAVSVMQKPGKRNMRLLQPFYLSLFASEDLKILFCRDAILGS